MAQAVEFLFQRLKVKLQVPLFQLLLQIPQMLMGVPKSLLVSLLGLLVSLLGRLGKPSYFLKLLTNRISAGSASEVPH